MLHVFIDIISFWFGASYFCMYVSISHTKMCLQKERVIANMACFIAEKKCFEIYETKRYLKIAHHFLDNSQYYAREKKVTQQHRHIYHGKTTTNFLLLSLISE